MVAPPPSPAAPSAPTVLVSALPSQSSNMMRIRPLPLKGPPSNGMGPRRKAGYPEYGHLRSRLRLSPRGTLTRKKMALGSGGGFSLSSISGGEN
jgi:hypothetical protein